LLATINLEIIVNLTIDDGWYLGLNLFDHIWDHGVFEGWDQDIGKLDTKKFTIDLNPNDIDITLTGGLVAKIANILIPTLKNSVIPDVIKQVESQVPTIINGQVDDDLKIYGSQQEIPFLGGVTADYAQVGGPQFTDSSIFQMGLNGTFFDKNNVKAPTGSPAAFTIHDP
jgi:hypothetical protein